MGLFFFFFSVDILRLQELNTDWSNLNRGCGKGEGEKKVFGTHVPPFPRL